MNDTTTMADQADDDAASMARDGTELGVAEQDADGAITMPPSVTWISEVRIDTCRKRLRTHAIATSSTETTT